MSDALADDPFGRAATILAHDEPHYGDAVVPPIFQTSLFTFSSYDEMAATFAGKLVRPTYSRGLNPTVRAFEEKVALLERTEDALGFASGMGAISSAVLAFVQPGDRILAVEHLYPDSFRFFEVVLKRFGITVDYIDASDLAAVEKALPGRKVFYLESPTSWMFQVHDLAALARLAKAAGAITIADNSWASPLFQQPVALGCDLVVHSASKYLGGHSDVVAGVVAGSRELVGKLRREVLPYLGAKLSPFDAWLLLRGLRTLPARMRGHPRASPGPVAAAIEGPRRNIRPVLDRARPLDRYPGLLRHPQALQARRELGRARKPDLPRRGYAGSDGRAQSCAALRRAGTDGSPEYRPGSHGIPVVRPGPSLRRKQNPEPVKGGTG
jgi:cystathionine beta-lyase/cystathionine gamma-synthase